MGLTKSEKDFWVKELDAELKEQIEEYRDAIDACLVVAGEKALRAVGVDALYKKVLKQYEVSARLQKQYKESTDEVKSTIKEINKKLDGYEYVTTRYGGVYHDDIEISFSEASCSFDPGVSDEWIKRLAKQYYLDDVMEKEGLVEPLRLEQVRKTLKRTIMLATTSTQLKEFLERFMTENDITL